MNFLNFKGKKQKKILQDSQKMSTQFAWITTVLIAIVCLIIAISIINFLQAIFNDLSYNSRKQDLNTAVKIFEWVDKTYVPGNPSIMEKRIKPFLEDEIISFVLIRDKKTERIIYSFDGRIKYNNTDRQYQDFTPEFVGEKYVVSVGFYEKKVLVNYLNSFLNKLSLLIVSSIFFGLLMSYLMFKIVNKPLEDLTKVAKEYKQGNFSAHLEKTNYEEINTLIAAYNSMGENLNELYTSLEMKVEERTLELEKAYKELQSTQSMMVHSEKMRSLGELVAGITHEINNPINFIYGNLFHLENYSKDLVNIINELSKLNMQDNSLSQDKVAEIREKYDFDFIASDLPILIKSCQEGTERTKDIIQNLKNFSRMGESTTSTVDIESEIDTTLTILNNKMKNKVVVHKNYMPNIPKIDAFGGQLNQVFMNILDNATYAIKDKGNIYINMYYDEKYVTIEFVDDGCGMTQEVADKIFDPFFTTKPVGDGTGLGMSISYKVIQNHNGKIKVESEVGKGTKFTLTLPILNQKITFGK